MSYEILDHTADAKFQAVGDSLEDVFSETVDAFADIAGGEGGNTRHSFKVKSESLEALLFDFLDELIYLQDTRDSIISHAESIEITENKPGYSLEAEVWTNPVTAGSNPLDIKGPTYSEMSIEHEQGTGWKIIAVLDI